MTKLKFCKKNLKKMNVNILFKINGILQFFDKEKGNKQLIIEFKPIAMRLKSRTTACKINELFIALR